MTDARRLLTIESWEHGRKTLHFETVIEPLTDLDRANAEAAWTAAGLDDLVEEIAAAGYTREVAHQRAVIMLATELARDMVDQAAYERVCAKKGLLPL